MRIRLRPILALLALWAALLLTTPACYDEEGLCMQYCRQAAECLSCPYSDESLNRCQDECVARTIAQQQDLVNCTKDCANFAACPSIVGFNPPNPCDY
jgi:hypothetical protein